MNANGQDLGNIFGEPIAVYSRRQAIEDGVLVDVSNVIDGDTAQACPFKYPVALSRAAYEETIAAGGEWKPNGEGETLELPGGQDVQGRLHDVFWMLQLAIRRANGPADRVHFSALVDVHGKGRRKRVDLYSVCGPGDGGEPVITIMLEGED